jgi:hypothetical protein
MQSPSKSTKFQLALVRVTALALLGAAVLKAANPEHSLPAMTFFVGQPFATSLLSLVVLFESFLGLILLVIPSLHTVRLAATGMMMLFSLALIVMLASNKPPSCGCFGALVAWESSRTEIWFGLGRNAAMIAVLLPTRYSA